ncbi:MAG: N-acetylmuramoyl-L-alanine amidase [Desulfosporosinus sp.]|nr:N-acetylmuramoyl-L-alanine amidase [Desulfosporosinus sp.]
MNLVKKIFFLLIVALAFVLNTPLLTYASPLAYPTERIAGQDRVETALKISQKGWDSAATVILCEYSDYPDSIAATPFAVSLNAPILLTAGDSIDPRVVQELQRLKPQSIILLGGTACLHPSIEKKLDNLSLKWERIGGTNRYETSVLLAQRLTSDSLILANGDDFPDALSAATFAGIKQIPIVLTSKTLPASVIQYYQTAGPAHLIVIGGEAVVPSSNLTKNKFAVETRLGGQDRYETNAQVVAFMKDTCASNDLFLASGITFPDAVAGTVLASKDKSPLLLTEKDDIPPSVYSLMREHMQIEPPCTSTSDSASAPKQGKTTASGGLNLRATPSTAGKMLTTIPVGTTINLLDLQNQWYKTTYQTNTGWVSATYVAPTTSNDSTANLDLSVNGTVYILGGTGIISSNTQAIIQGQASSNYTDNLKAFPALPSEINIPSSPPDTTPVTPPDTTPVTPPDTTPVTPPDTTPVTPPDTTPVTPPDTTPVTPPDTTPSVPTTYDPASDVLLDPFQGMPANSLAGKTIMLDPGHGGPDTGAIGPNNTYEKNNTLAIALALNDILKEAGANVILTRDTDVSPATADYSETADLQARVDLANKDNPDIFVCIHNDSFTNPDVQGTSTYYSDDNPKENESIQLANSIQGAVIDTVNTKNRGVKDAAFYVLRKTTMPSILLEAAFISSPYEEARLQNPTFQKNLATAIFHGIYNYYQTPPPQA